MQAATNSVLSTASNVPSKGTSTSSSQAPKSQGGSFADDFKRASQSLNTSRDNNVADSDASQRKGSSDASVDQQKGNVSSSEEKGVTTSGSKVAKAQSDEGNDRPSKDGSSQLDDENRQNKTAATSGKALQSQGEISPEGEPVKANPLHSKVAGLTSSNIGPSTDSSALQNQAAAKNVRLTASDTNKVENTVGSDQNKAGTTSTTGFINNTGTNAEGKLPPEVAPHSLQATSPSLTSDTSQKEPSQLVNQSGTTVQHHLVSDGKTKNLTNVQQSNHLTADKTSDSQANGSGLQVSDKTGLLVDAQGDAVVLDADGRPITAQSSEASIQGGAAGEKTIETAKVGKQISASQTNQSVGLNVAGSVGDSVQKQSDSQPQTLSQSQLNSEGGQPVVKLAQADVAPATPDSSANVVGQGDVLSAKEADKMSKVPPEVLALERATKKANASTVDLSAFSSGADKSALLSKALAADKVPGGKGSDVKSAKNAEGQTVSKADSEADNSDLSWVLSQMASNPLAQAGGAASAVAAASSTSGKSSVTSLGEKTVGDKGSTSKVADQVALVNAVKGSPIQPSDTPLILSGTGASSSDATDLLDGNGLTKDGAMPNEPIELRKKEQDALIGKMTAQFDGAGQDADTGGMGSSLSTQSNGRLAAGIGAPAAAQNLNVPNPNIQQNLAMSVPPNHPGWAGEMGQKVAWLAQGGSHSAHIKLDPPELGSLTVKVSVDSDNNNTQVSFVVATPHTRDLLEGQMGRLRDMLAQQGMDLGSVNVDVSQQDTSGAQYQNGYQDDPVMGQGRLANQEDVEEDLASGNISYVTPAGIDYYA